jgi:hypothetical protein
MSWVGKNDYRVRHTWAALSKGRDWQAFIRGIASFYLRINDQPAV